VGETARRLFDEILTLPEDERLDLASAAWASVDREPDADWESAWQDEVTRRLADPRPSVEWDEVRRDLRAAVTKKR